MQNAKQHRVLHSAFEGLFVHALPRDEKLTAALRAEGFDLDAQLPEYPSEVWQACLRVAAHHTYPKLLPEVAHAALGRRFVDGFFKTVFGKLAAVVVSMVGPSVLIRRSKGFFMSGAPGLEVQVEERTRTHFVVRFVSPVTNPDFDSAILLELVERAGAKQPRWKLTSSASGFELDVQW